jgi:hypothetical protein
MTVKPSLFGGQETFPPVVVVVPNVVVPNVVVEKVVVAVVVVVGGLIVIVGGVVTTPMVFVVSGAVETTGMDAPGWEFLSSVAARATKAPDTRATSRRAARAAQSQIGESRRQT